MNGTHPEDLFEDVKLVEMTNAEYHSAPWKSVSASRLKTFADDPYHFFCQFISEELPRKETAALFFGRVAHEVILEHQGIVNESNYTSKTLGVFRPCGTPKREPDVSTGGEDLWIVSHPEPGIVRRASFWGEMDGGRKWLLSPDRGGNVETAICAFADMHIDGVAFITIPGEVLSASGQRRGKAWDAWEAEHDGEVILSDAEWSSVLWMRQRLRHHGTAYRRLFCGGKPEVSIVGKCVHTGLEVRTRLDFLVDLEESTLITDLKTTRDAAPSIWNKQCVGDMLHVQAAIQIGLASHLYDKIDYAFAAVDKAAPHRPEVFHLEPELLEVGVEDYRKIMEDFERCASTGMWFHQGFGESVPLVVPAWRMPKWQ